MPLPNFPSRSPRPALSALLMLCGLTLAACGGGGDDDGSSNPPPALPALAAPQALASGGALGRANWPEGDTSSGGQGQAVQGIACGLMDESYHVHAHLSIFLNGQMLQVPSDVGILPATDTRDSCTYAVHTHDGTGKIHVEAPAPARFTLGQFFAIWGQPLGSGNVAGLSGLPVTVYVTDGGVVTRYAGDFGEIELLSHREITVQVGSAVAEIPNYQWEGN